MQVNLQRRAITDLSRLVLFINRHPAHRPHAKYLPSLRARELIMHTRLKKLQ